MEYLLGIDVGTTNTKAALFDIKGEIIDFESKSYSLRYPKPGWAEQNPEDWWNAFIETIKTIVLRNNCSDNIISLGLSTQGGALILLDSNYKPLYPAVSWMDTRASEVENDLIKEISKKELYRLCGWPITSGLNLPVIFWFKRKRPDLYKKATYFASTIDFFNYRLTGKFVIDYSNLALTEFLDLDRRDYSEKALSVVNLKRKNLPSITPSGRIIGRLKEDVAEQLGISDKTIVVSGAHDQYSAGVGAGAIEVGDCTLSAGTAWVLLAVTNKLIFNERSIEEEGIAGTVNPGIHPINEKYGLMTSLPFGGNALNWFRDTIRKGNSFEMLDMEAASIEAGSNGLIFIPLMSSSSGKGAFIGIDASQSIKHFTRAVFEGVALTNKKHFELIENTGVKIKRLIMIGGGSKSKIWPQIVADVCNVPVMIPEVKEAACAGAAILAGVGAGVFSSIEDGSRKIAKIDKTILTRKVHFNTYSKIYKRLVNLQKNVI